MYALFFLLAFASSRFGPEAVWQPSTGFRQSVDSGCENRGAEFGKCFERQMKAAGASAEALAFTDTIGDNGYMQGFRPVGPVAVASVMYPFRANENNALLLINGLPVVIDVDALNRRQLNQMREDPAYQAMLKNHPNATLWPGDRSSVDSLLALAFTDGSRELVAGYRIQDGCHACAVLGQAFFGFHFDQNGKMMFVRFTGFSPLSQGSEAPPLRMLRTMPGKTFTALLPANPSTGFSWMLTPIEGPSEPQLLGHKYEPNENGIGRNGEERWTFRAPDTGEYKLTFSYKRPWEKNTAPAQVIEILLLVE